MSLFLLRKYFIENIPVMKASRAGNGNIRAA